jgi:hypothetical protein
MMLLPILKSWLSLEPVWLSSPAKYEAVAVPALVLFASAVGVRFNPPAPVTLTVAGVCAEPV